MFTTEIDHDEIKITILDDTAFHEDVRFFIYDDCVIIQQWDEEMQNFSEIIMSPDMFDEFTASLTNPEGAFRLKNIDKVIMNKPKD